MNLDELELSIYSKHICQKKEIRKTYLPVLPPLKKVPIRVLIEEDRQITEADSIKKSDVEDELTPPSSITRFDKYSPSNFKSNFKYKNIFQPSYDHSAFTEVKTCQLNHFRDGELTYTFAITKSRKKDKKFLSQKQNKITSRVHNMDCLLKKIKAKYLKYLFLKLKSYLKDLDIDLRKFDQCKEVRNLNIKHNRENFISFTIMKVLIFNSILNESDIEKIENSNNSKLNELLAMKVKLHYQFDFLYSDYYKNWVNDPIKIRKDSNVKENKNCIKFPHHSKNIFKNDRSNYDIYKSLLLRTSCAFIIYFQNNSLKFGKKS